MAIRDSRPLKGGDLGHSTLTKRAFAKHEVILEWAEEEGGAGYELQ